MPSLNGSKRDRFKKLAEQKTNAVMHKLKVLGNCSNRSAYEYTEEDVAKIFSAVERQVREIKAKFHFPKKQKFKL